jgi:hypothetical protein
MRFMLLVTICAAVVSAQDAALDGLLQRSQQSRVQSKQLRGFVFRQNLVPPESLKTKQNVTLMSPDSLFKKEESVTQVASLSPMMFRHESSNQYVTAREYDKDIAANTKRLDAIDERITKVSEILNNLQDQSDSQSKHMDYIIKIIEAITVCAGALGALAGILLKFRVKVK